MCKTSSNMGCFCDEQSSALVLFSSRILLFLLYDEFPEEDKRINGINLEEYSSVNLIYFVLLVCTFCSNFHIYYL